MDKPVDPLKFQRKDARTVVRPGRKGNGFRQEKKKKKKISAEQVAAALMEVEEGAHRAFTHMNGRLNGIYGSLDNIQRELSILSYLVSRTVSTSDITQARNALNVIETFMYLVSTCQRVEGLEFDAVPLETIAQLKMRPEVIEAGKKEGLPARMLLVFAEDLTSGTEPSMSFLIDWDSQSVLEIENREELENYLTATPCLFAVESAFFSGISGEAPIAALFSKALFRLHGPERLHQLLNGLDLDDLQARAEAALERAQEIAQVQAEGTEVYAGHVPASEELVGGDDVGDVGGEESPVSQPS